MRKIKRRKNYTKYVLIATIGVFHVWESDIVIYNKHLI